MSKRKVKSGRRADRLPPPPDREALVRDLGPELADRTMRGYADLKAGRYRTFKTAEECVRDIFGDDH
jgi:hypothetical protein